MESLQPVGRRETMDQWISRAFFSDVGWDHLEGMVDIGNRLAGTEGERRGAELTAEKLEDIGARNVSIDEFPIVGWERKSSAIVHEKETIRGPSHQVIALPRSPSESVEGELLDLGTGVPSDFEETDVEGKIVFVTNDVPSGHRPVRRREKYALAVENGAAAFVHRSNVDGCLPKSGGVGEKVTDWETRRKDPIGDIPAVTVSKESGMRLSRRFAGDRVRVEVEADIDRENTTSQNVHAELGPETDEQVLVTSHIDAHDLAEGATDNGAGVAVMVEIANALASQESALDTRVQFISFGTEELGFVGSEYAASKLDLDSVKAMVNIDSPARYRQLQIYTPFEEIQETIGALGRETSHPVEVVPRPYPIADQWPFVKHGVPGMLVGCMPDSAGKQKFNDPEYHTHADTLDKLDVRNIREQTILLTRLVKRLAGDDAAYPHYDPDVIRDAVKETGWAEQDLRAINNWPYED